jgi:hypothetical protein
MAAGNRPPDRACVIHHTTDELLEQQNAVSDAQATSVLKTLRGSRQLTLVARGAQSSCPGACNQAVRIPT